MSFTFACVLRSGGLYSPQWVERLCRQVREHLEPERIVCLTDMPLDCCTRAQLTEGWPGWYSKIELFRPGLFAGPVFYADLDSLILRPIPRLADKITTVARLLMLDDFYQPKIPASGVMAWVPSPATERIYHEFAERPMISSSWAKGDGWIIGRHPHGRLQSYFPGAFQSWNVCQRSAAPVTAAVLCFHGKTKNHSFAADHWITRAWLGEPSNE